MRRFSIGGLMIALATAVAAGMVVSLLSSCGRQPANKTDRVGRPSADSAFGLQFVLRNARRVDHDTVLFTYRVTGLKRLSPGASVILNSIQFPGKPSGFGEQCRIEYVGIPGSDQLEVESYVTLPKNVDTVDVRQSVYLQNAEKKRHLKFVDIPVSTAPIQAKLDGKTVTLRKVYVDSFLLNGRMKIVANGKDDWNTLRFAPGTTGRRSVGVELDTTDPSMTGVLGATSATLTDESGRRYKNKGVRGGDLWSHGHFMSKVVYPFPGMNASPRRISIDFVCQPPVQPKDIAWLSYNAVRIESKKSVSTNPGVE